MTIKQQLKEYRNDIDSIDSQIIHLLNERFEIAEDVGYLKKLSKKNILDAKRENIIMKKVAKESLSIFEKNICKVFECIMKNSKQIQNKVKIK